MVEENFTMLLVRNWNLQIFNKECLNIFESPKSQNFAPSELNSLELYIAVFSMTDENFTMMLGGQNSN